MKETSAATIDRRKGYFINLFNGNRIVIALSFAHLGDAIGNSILIVVIPLYVAKLPSPWLLFPEPVRVGILISLFGRISALMQPIFGAVSDQVHRRKNLILVGLFIIAVATLTYLFDNRYTDLLILRVAQGIGVALTISASMTLMASATQKATRGGSMGVYSTMRTMLTRDC